MSIKKLVAIGIIITPVFAMAANASLSKEQIIKNETNKLSYTLGVEMGDNFKNQDVTVNTEALVQGLRDGLKGNKPLMSKKDMETTLMRFQKELIAKRDKEYQVLSEKNLKQGKAFLELNSKQPDVKTLADGLQYKIIKQGAGQVPTKDDVVTVNYVGKFVDGTVFDSSYKRGKPASFSLSEVIPGWQQALQKMHVGSTWELYLPPQLAYGEHGMGNLIGPNETLIFKIQLLKINQQSENS